MAFGSVIRFNPERAPTEKPIGGMDVPSISGGLKQIGIGGGALTAHLGHFRNPSITRAGHNTMGKHPGFKALVASGVPAGALAKTSRNASVAAKRKNPRLRRVK